MLSKRKAMIGYGVYTLGKPLAKRKLRQQQAEAARRKKLFGFHCGLAARFATSVVRVATRRVNVIAAPRSIGCCRSSDGW